MAAAAITITASCITPTGWAWRLEPFTQVNYNAYVHSTNAYGGKPKRYREVQADFHGHVAELSGQIHQAERAGPGRSPRRTARSCWQALKAWGALDGNYEYVKGLPASNAARPGGRSRRRAEFAAGTFRSPIALCDRAEFLYVAHHRLRAMITNMQSSIFQPKGGMGQIGKAFGKELGTLIKYNCKVIDIHQDDKGVTATYIDSRTGGAPQKATADWCVCTIPASILSQIPMNVSGQDEGGDQPAFPMARR